MPKPVFYSRPRRRRTLLVIAAIGAVVALMVALISDDNDGKDHAVSTSAPPEEQDPALLHVHGLGVNPADAALYVATHSGLFRLSGHGDAVLVGTHRYDLMGFTVARTGAGCQLAWDADRHDWTQHLAPAASAAGFGGVRVEPGQRHDSAGTDEERLVLPWGAHRGDVPKAARLNLVVELLR